MGPLGFPEMFAIFVIALLLFGPKKLPELGRTLGKAITEFRRAKNELKTTFESHLQELEKETRLLENSSTSSSNNSPSYSYPYEDYNRYDPGSPDYSAPSQITSAETSDPASLPTASTGSSEEPQTDFENPHAAPSITGTVARVNGVRPIEEGIETAREEHRV